MFKVNNENKINDYIEKYKINDFFTVDMTNFMELHSFNKDEHIYRANDKIEYFYFFVEGKAKVYTLLANGKSLLIMFCNPLRIVGDVEVLYSDAATCNLQALKECLCIGISVENIRKYAMEDSVFLKHMCKSLGEKIAHSSLSSSINLLYPLENRLASYILAITPGGENLPPGGDTSPVEQIVTEKLTEIAELLGTSYRHLNRVINKFCEDGLIKKENHKIVVLDRDSLSKLAGDLYQ